MARPALPPEIDHYLDHLVPPRPPEMQAMEAYARDTDFPIIGPSTGYTCYLLARLIGARKIFELGSGYGYSTAWFARAVRENGGGTVYHVEWDEALSRQARQHLNVLGYGDLIEYHVAEAISTLKGMEGPFDLIFNDVDKQFYPEALPVIAEKLRPGGILIADNVLYHHRIFDPRDVAPTTQGIRDFNRLIMNDPAWIASIDPVRDGILVAYKR